MAFPLLVPDGPDALKINNFDAIRLTMACLVVWSHSFALYLGSEATEPLSIVTNGMYNSGNLAVLVFFMISGFLICHSYIHRKSLVQYFSRRVRRIYPGYLAATLIGAFVIVPLFSSLTLSELSGVECFKIISLNLLLRNYAPPSDAFGGRAINGSLWSIPYEFWCYIGLAALGLTQLLSRRAVCLAIVVLTEAVRVWLDLTGRRPGGGLIELIIGWQYAWFGVLPCFMMGVTVYLYRDIIPRSRLLVIVGLAGLIGAAHLPIAPPLSKITTDLLFPPVIAYVVFFVAFSNSLKLGNAARWGDFSYGTYLYAFPIQRMLLAGLGTTIGFRLYIVASMSLALLAGVMSWYFVEVWFLPSSRQHRGATH